MTRDLLVAEARPVDIPASAVTLRGILSVPLRPRGFVVFVHGSGSGRLSPRNLAVAATLQSEQLGTLLFDLLTPAEAVERGNVFDIGLLTGRLEAATNWLRCQPEAAGLPIGFFGASTGAAAAIVAAGRAGHDVAAVVSRGGRPDLAGAALPDVTAPTLLLVGGNDDQVLELNRAALARMSCPKRLRVIPGATHLFEEPGALEEVARLAAGWFVESFTRRP